MRTVIDPRHAANMTRLALDIAHAVEHHLPDAAGCDIATALNDDPQAWQAAWRLIPRRTTPPSEATRTQVVTLLNRRGTTTHNERNTDPTDPFDGLS